MPGNFKLSSEVAPFDIESGDERQQDFQESNEPITFKRRNLPETSFEENINIRDEDRNGGKIIEESSRFASGELPKNNKALINQFANTNTCGDLNIDISMVNRLKVPDFYPYRTSRGSQEMKSLFEQISPTSYFMENQLPKRLYSSKIQESLQNLRLLNQELNSKKEKLNTNYKNIFVRKSPKQKTMKLSKTIRTTGSSTRQSTIDKTSKSTLQTRKRSLKTDEINFQIAKNCPEKIQSRYQKAINKIKNNPISKTVKNLSKDPPTKQVTKIRQRSPKGIDTALNIQQKPIKKRIMGLKNHIPLGKKAVKKLLENNNTHISNIISSLHHLTSNHIDLSNCLSKIF